MHRQFFKEWHSYITPGFGGRYVMDDANVPVSYFYLSPIWIIETLQQSLLSLPYLGFLDRSDPAYIATRKLLLSRNNPYYSAGKTFNGVG